MREIIKINNASYSRYEELLSKRDELCKKAFQYYKAYMREFGALILEVFQIKIECIKKKKTIEFYQAAINRGDPVDRDALDAFITQEMSEYQRQFEDMIEEQEAAKQSIVISETDVLKVKSIYRKIAKLIHPDINPKVNGSEELTDLWNRVVIAYQCNALKEIQELEVLVNKALETLGIYEIEIDIPDIDSRIDDILQEIHNIETTEPYTYRILLEDEGLVAEKKESLKLELEEYTDYSKELDGVIEGLLSGGVSIIWQMN
ncbi:MAG: hypothetical protein IKS48_08780 [Eubacterium sp.]|nr:hypothetical protein [Eubacterium sp.]